MKIKLAILLLLAVTATACTPRVVRDEQGNVRDVVVDFGIRDSAPAPSMAQADRGGRPYSRPTESLMPISPAQERRWIDSQKARIRGDWTNAGVSSPPGMAMPTTEQFAYYRAQAQRELDQEAASKTKAPAKKSTAPVKPKKPAEPKPAAVPETAAPAVPAPTITPTPTAPAAKDGLGW